MRKPFWGESSGNRRPGRWRLRLPWIGRRLRMASGQALVEFAIVFLPVCLIIMGGIDFGAIFKDVIAVRQGVSDGARQAAVGQFGASASCGLTGATGSASTQDLMCLVHSLDGVNNDAKTRVAIFVGDSAHQGSYVVGQPVTICEQYQEHSLTGILSFINGNVAMATATDRVEVQASGGLTSGQETSLKGSWPAVCTTGPNPA